MVKKVIIFIPAIEKGGVERNAIWLANELILRDILVDVVFVRVDSEQKDKFDNRVNLVQFQCKKAKYINQRIADASSIRNEFAAYLKRQKKEETVVIAFQSASVAIDICRKNGIKVICRLSNHPSAVNYEKSLLRKVSEKVKILTYKKADVIIGNSKRLSEDFGKAIKREVVTIYNPINFEKIYRAQNEEIADELKIEAEKYSGKLFITVGRLSKQKNMETLIRGFALCKYRSECKLWIVGDGSERKTLENIIKEEKLEDNIRLIGYQSNVYKYLKYADLFIQTSLYEGCPNALIEAVAAGVPAIATDCLSGPQEVLVGGEGGDLIAVYDYKALGKRIDEYIENPDKLKEKQKIAHKNLDRFENNVVIQKYLDVLEKVINE